LDGLAKSYLHSQKLLGRDPKSLIAIPGADDVEGLNNVYAALGRPDSIDKYQLTAPKLPEGLTVDEKLQSGFLTKAHELGLNNRQVDALYQWWNQENGNVYSQSVEARQQKGREAEQSLRKDWGQAFDQNLALGEAALNHYALTLNLGEDLSNQLKAEGLNNSPAVIKLLSHLGAQLSEDGVLGKGDGGAGEKALSPGEAQQEIAGLKNDKLFQADYLNKKAPGHAAAVKRMERLYQFAYPVS